MRERRKQAGASHIGHINGSMISSITIGFQHKHLPFNICQLTKTHYNYVIAIECRTIIIINNHPGPHREKYYSSTL